MHQKLIEFLHNLVILLRPGILITLVDLVDLLPDNLVEHLGVMGDLLVDMLLHFALLLHSLHVELTALVQHRLSLGLQTVKAFVFKSLQNVLVSDGHD